MKGASTAQQNELLYQHGINFNDIPHWQRRRTGLHWQGYQKTGSDPRTGIQATATRRTLARQTAQARAHTGMHA
jgi:tRNA(His) 5'-end guanylyltransferase